MAAKFKMSTRGVGQMLNSPWMGGEILRRAEAIKTAAEVLSPVGGPGDPHPGKYKGSWYAKVQRKPVGRSQKKRPVGVVGNRSYYARWVEYGTERVPAHHVLLRAARAGGG
ncbi:HK97 gp10 family phage protein [Streptomyces goshikiensis]|uniref:HK97 gp10 family phage protein n=1 Tax=Streptomyces goshikiensis TaxID=1942 RepID=UPI00364E8C1B